VKNENNGGIQNVIDSYNELKMGEVSAALDGLAFTVALYYNKLTQLGVDIETARSLSLGLQQGMMDQVKNGGKP